MPHNKRLSKAPTQRQLRVGELVRHALSGLLLKQEVHDEVLIKIPIAITEVEVSPNLRYAKIYVISLGSKNNAEILEALNINKRYIRGRLGNIVKLKFVPEIDFAIDKSFDNYNKINEILNREEVRRDIISSSDSDDDSNTDTDDLDNHKTIPISNS